MRDVTFHIGLWKTGTTFLQKKVFHGEGFGGKHNTPSPLLNSFRECFIHGSPKFWGSKVGISMLNEVFSGVDVFSTENFYRAKVFMPGLANWAGNDQLNVASHFKSMQESMRENLGINFKVLFFFRRQPEWLASMYSELSQYQVGCTTKDFEDKVKKMIDNPYLYGDNLLLYDELLEAIINSLGKDSVMAFPYEKFQDKHVWQEIEGFVSSGRVSSENIDFSVRVNEKINIGGDSNIKRWNLYQKGEKGVKKEALILSGQLESMISAHYELSNKRMGFLVGEDLGALGYY